MATQVVTADQPGRWSWRRWGAIYFLAGLYLFFWVNYWFTSYFMVKQEAEQHAQPFLLSEVWLRWWDGTSENKMSEAWIGVVAYLLIERPWAKKKWLRAEES